MGNLSQRIRNFFLLALAAAYFLPHGRADKTPRNPRKFLVVQLAKIGDMICATPVFRAIKKKYPQGELLVLGNETNKELLAGSSDVDCYIAFKNNIFETIRNLRRKKIDFALLTGPSPEILAMLYLSGIPAISAPEVIGGFCPQQTRAYKILKNFVITFPHRFGYYAPGEYLRLLEPVGIFTKDTAKHLAYSEAAGEKVREFLREHGVNLGDFVVGIAPGTGKNKDKLWGRDKFATVADYLFKKHNAKIIIVAGPEDKKEVAETVSFLDPATKFTLAEGFNADKLKFLISRLSLFISVDTGPIYIAEAFGVPTIDIVGPMDEREQPPRGRKHFIVKSPHRFKPALHVMNNQIYDKVEAKKQSEDITADMAIKAIDQIIYENNIC